MAEKKSLDLAKIDVSTDEDFEWFNINMKLNVEKVAEALQTVIGSLDEVSAARGRFLTTPQLEQMVKDLFEVLERRKQAEAK